MASEDNLLAQLMDDDDITWQSMIFELVKTGEMDPWDVSIGDLSEKFISMIDEMQETNLKVGGKVVLASTILLRLKSGRFIENDLAQLEALIASVDSYDDDFEEWDDLSGDGFSHLKDKRNYKIYPRTPQPRKRKVSVYDLVTALESVIEKNKIKIRYKKNNSKEPKELKLESRDVNSVIKDVFETLNKVAVDMDSNKLNFSQILPSKRKEDLIATFLPLLHLTNQRVTDLHQDEAFSDFEIHLLKRGLTFEDLSKIVQE